MNTIDLVVPYVDSTDPAWQELFNKYNPIKDKEVEGINAKNRFRGQGDFFRFFFRGIEKFAPWVRTVHLLVQSESQIPKWINRNEVHVVLHEQFMPKEFLPTFNSTAIEMFLWNIPGLSEKFVYANDDFFITNYINRDNLFQDVSVVAEVFKVTRLQNSMYQTHVDNSYKEIYHNLQDGVMTIGHTLRPYFKSDMVECFNRHKEAILKSISMFRETKNFNVYLYTFDLMRKGKIINEKRVPSCCIYSLTGALRMPTKMVTCIQDVDGEANIYENKDLISLYKQKFTSISKYEDPTVLGGITEEQIQKVDYIVSNMPEEMRDKMKESILRSWAI